MSSPQIKGMPGRFPSRSPTPPPQSEWDEILCRSFSNSSKRSARGLRLGSASRSPSPSPITPQRCRRSPRLSSPTPSVQSVHSEAPSESASRANTPLRRSPRPGTTNEEGQSPGSINVPRKRPRSARPSQDTRESLSPNTAVPRPQRSASDTTNNRPTSHLNWVREEPIAARDADDCIRDRIRDFHKTLKEQRKRKEKNEARSSIDIEDTNKPRGQGKAKVATGVIYILRCTDPRWSGLVKIGWTRGSVTKRKGGGNGIERKCKIKLENVWDSGRMVGGRIAHCPQVEKLIHDDLANRRRRYKCDVCKNKRTKCPATHDEWFEISEGMATQTVERWVRFMLHTPYNESGVLKPEWEAHLQRTETWLAKNDDLRWAQWNEFVDNVPEEPTPPPPPPSPSTLQQCQIWLAAVKENRIFIFIWYSPREFFALCTWAVFVCMAFWNSFVLLGYLGSVGFLCSVGFASKGLVQADTAKISRLGMLRHEGRVTGIDLRC